MITNATHNTSPKKDGLDRAPSVPSDTGITQGLVNEVVVTSAACDVSRNGLGLGEVVVYVTGE